MLMSQIACARILKPKAALMLLTACLTIQLFDINQGLYPIRSYYSSIKQKDFYESDQIRIEQDLNVLEQIVKKHNIKYVVFTSAEFKGEFAGKHTLYKISEWALKHKLKLNQFYFSRPLNKIQVNKNIRNFLLNPEKSIFITPKTDKNKRVYNRKFYTLETEDIIINYLK